jgi:hypothetical protein
LGYDLIRDDNKVRAKLYGKSTIMFYSNEFDRALTILKEKAPISIKGF